MKMDFKETGCEGERSMEVAQDCIQWQEFVIAILIFTFCHQKVIH